MSRPGCAEGQVSLVSPEQMEWGVEAGVHVLAWCELPLDAMGPSVLCQPRDSTVTMQVEGGKEALGSGACPGSGTRRAVTQPGPPHVSLLPFA